MEDVMAVNSDTQLNLSKTCRNRKIFVVKECNNIIAKVLTSLVQENLRWLDNDPGK